MVGDTGTRYFAHVCSQVETGGIENLPQDFNTTTDNFNMLVEFLGSQVIQIGCVAEGHNQEMTGVIGISIHNNEVFITPVQYVIGVIIILQGFFTKNASWWFLFLDVLHTPGRPDLLHIFLPLNVPGSILIGYTKLIKWTELVRWLKDK